MVDPKRHINILSEEDQMFLNECEEEFKDRFTENDPEFQTYCAQPSRPPPVVEPWQNRNFHGGSHGGHQGGGRGRFNDRGRFHHNRNRNFRSAPYDASQRGNRYNNPRGDHQGNRYNSNVDRRF